MYDHRLSPSLRPLAGATHLRAVTLPVRPGWRAGDPQVCYHTRQNREKQKHTWGCGDTCGAQVKRKWLRSVCKQMNVRWNAQTSLEPSCGCFWNPSIVSLNFNKITFLCKKWDTRSVCVCFSCRSVRTSWIRVMSPRQVIPTHLDQRAIWRDTVQRCYESNIQQQNIVSDVGL